MNNVCRWCGNRITIAIFKGEDWCSELCRKALEKAEIFDKQMSEWKNNPPIIVPPERITNAQRVEQFAEMLKEAATGMAAVGVSEEDILDGGLKGALDLAQAAQMPNSKRRYLYQKFEETDSFEVSAKEKCGWCDRPAVSSALHVPSQVRFPACSVHADGHGHQELKATGDTPDSVAAGAYWLRRVDKTPYRHYPCNVPLKDLTEAGDEVEWWECPACGKHTSGKRLYEEGEHRG